MLRALGVTITFTLFVSGCDSTGPETTPAGTWDLISVGGRSLPVIVHPESDPDWEIRSGVLRLEEGGDFSDVLAQRWYERTSGEITGSEEIVDTMRGTWRTVSDQLIHLEFNGISGRAEWTGSEMYRDPDTEFVLKYQRR